MSRLGRRGIAAIAGALWLATLPAHAAEHAGTSSPLSTGAGNRALAMGGAFAAVADNASGWMWNPGGLGLVSRGHVEITQFAPADLDYSDIFAGLVLPSWRWGALALGYRQIGVSGIEARDARNQVVATGLSDRESEIALGYGNALGEAWSFGVVAKARSHQLAGRSAGALGADLGVILHPAALLGSGGWLRDLTVGAAFQNAVRPSIRLDVDPVPDPRAARAGLAYRHALTGGRGLLFALDLDRTRISSPRLHAGVELKPHPMLDLRVGLNQSELATGAGLRVGRLSFDYAFENNPLAPSHRVGLSVGFGATVAESRLADLRTREAEIQKRLDQAFEERQSARIRELMAQAEQARTEANLDQALEVLGVLRALEPENAPATALMVECHRGKAEEAERSGNLAAAMLGYQQALELAPADSAAARALARCRAASDRRAARSAELRRQFQAALDALTGEDLPTARRGFHEIVGTNPRDIEAQAMLRRVDQAIERRAAGWLADAIRLTRSGLLDEAQRAIDQARALEPELAGLPAAVAALTRAREARSGSDTAKTTPRPDTTADSVVVLTPEQRREVDELYRRGLDAAKRGHEDQAVNYWELVWEKYPSYPRVVEDLKRVYLNRGLDAFAAGQLGEAVRQWERALRIDPADARTRAYLTRAQAYLSRVQEIGAH